MSRKQQVALALVAALVLAVTGYFTLAGREQTLPAVEPTAAETNTPAQGETCLVHVAGEVMRPGVYKLNAGDRIFQAIEAAGGSTGAADLDALNLAAGVSDGQKIKVPTRGASPSGPDSGTAGEPGGRININTADAPLLDDLPGIGPATAEKIVDYRGSHGAFARPEDIMNVPGIGPAKFSKLKDRISVK